MSSSTSRPAPRRPTRASGAHPSLPLSLLIFMSLTHHSILSLSLCVSVDICRDKAAFSRNKTIESMEEVAQGRVWTGQDAHGHGLVDYVGGFDKAVEVAKELAGIPEKDGCRFIEVASSAQRSPVLDLLRNSSQVVNRLATAVEMVDRLTDERVGYDATMPGINIKSDGGKSWKSNGDNSIF